MTKLWLISVGILTIIVAGAVAFALPSTVAPNHHPAIVGPAGSVSWKLLAGAKGFGFTKELQYIPRYYPDAVKKLADSEILIKGYMVAIQPRAKFSSFLLVPFPPTCPYCIPVGPAQIIETHTRAPVGFSLEPVLLRGTLRLRDDDMSGLFYLMEDAEIAENN